MDDNEARGVAQLLTWAPGCPLDRLAINMASAIGYKIADGTLTSWLCEFLESFQLGREILQLVYERLQAGFELPPTTEPVSAVLLEVTASLRDDDREQALTETTAEETEAAAAAGDAKKAAAWGEVAKAIARGSAVGSRAMAAANRELFRRHTILPPVRSSWSAGSVLRPLKRFVASRRARRTSSSTAVKANGLDPPDGPGGRPLGQGAAPNRDIENGNAQSIAQINGEINELLIGEPWSGDLAGLAPLLMLMRDEPGEPWRAVELSPEHATDLLTWGSA